MKKILTITFSIVMIVLVNGLVFGRNYYGQPNDYLQYGVGARALGMGGAYVGLADESSAAYWNPAGLALMDEFEMSSMYASFFEGTSLNFISSAHPLGPKFGCFAIADVLLYSGGFEERDYLNNLISTDESIMHNTIIGSYAKKFGKMYAGANLKLVQEKDIGYAGNGYGIDLGGMYQVFSMMRIGMMISNVVRPKVILREDENIYKTNIKTGVALESFGGKAIMTVDVNRLEGEKAYYSGGIEVSPWGRLVSFRLGLNHLSELNFGLGAGRGPFDINYAYSGHDSLGSLHRVSLNVRWFNIYRGKAKPKLRQGKERTGGENEYVLDGLHNEMQFEIGLPQFEVRDWALEVKDESDEIVRVVKGEHQPPKVVIWDMKDETGRPVKEGLYRYKFKVVYKDEKEWEERNQIRIRFSVPIQGEVEMQLRGKEGEIEEEEQEKEEIKEEKIEKEEGVKEGEQ